VHDICSTKKCLELNIDFCDFFKEFLHCGKDEFVEECIWETAVESAIV
jgi:hypothetical protein